MKTARRLPRPQAEDATQIALLEWLEVAHPQVWPWTHHSANGGHRNLVTGVRLKAMGVRKGFPDLTLWLPRGGFNGLAIELKVGRNRPTIEQLAWLDHMASVGWFATLCVGFDAARRSIEDYIALPPAQKTAGASRPC